jgi:hypothetical protein
MFHAQGLLRLSLDKFAAIIQFLIVIFVLVNSLCLMQWKTETRAVHGDVREILPQQRCHQGKDDIERPLSYNKQEVNTCTYNTVAGENVRASGEKSGNQRLANLPTCYYKYVYVIVCIQSCPILRGINISSLQYSIYSRTS